MKDRIYAVIGNFLYRRFKRTARTVNPADPTYVVQYTWRDRRPSVVRPTRIHIILTCCYGVESTVYVGMRQWNAYDHPVAAWVVSLMEDAHDRIMQSYDEDPMGYPESYR